jgi:hypothetical protein
MAADESRAARGTSIGTKLSASLGIVAAMVLAVLVNVYVGRHYKRWDVTKGGLFTLSEATLTTLHALEEPIEIHVLLPSGDPLAVSVQHLLEAYGSETSRLVVKLTDPDRHPAEFLATQQKYGIVAGKTDDGRIVTDASIVVVRGDKPYFITDHDLVEVEDGEDVRARPRIEQAITGAIRALLANDTPRICFTSGHGEHSTEVGGGSGLAPLRDRLVKNNFDVVTIPPASDPDAGKTPLSSCRVLVVAGPSEKVPPADADRIRAYLEGGGNALFAVGPQPDESDDRYLDVGLDPVLAAAGLAIDRDFLFEREPKYRSTQGFGETFMPIAKPHAITDGLVKEADRGVTAVLTVGSSLRTLASSRGVAVPLLTTSDQAFGMVDFFKWAKDPGVPEPTDADQKGPLTVAYAVELPKVSERDPHGPRVVAIGSTSALFGANWQSEELRGTAIFVESAIAWLAAKPVFLDIPNKPAFTAGLHLSEDSLAAIFRYVVVFMPLAPVLFGVAVWLRRRSGERRKPPRGAGKERDLA